MPATLQATIAARIDRLDPKAKRTISAAAVVGSRFNLPESYQLYHAPVAWSLAELAVLNRYRERAQ